MKTGELIEELKRIPAEMNVVLCGERGHVSGLAVGAGQNATCQITGEGDVPERSPVSWRHAVRFDAPWTARQVVEAEQLLSEWGVARGLAPRDLREEIRDYRVGFAMEFAGEITAPTERTRLQGAGARWPEQVEGREEHVPWPIPRGWWAPLADEAVDVGQVLREQAAEVWTKQVGE